VKRRLFLSARQFSEKVGCCERTTRRDIASGAIPSIKIGGKRLIPIAELAAVCGINPLYLEIDEAIEKPKMGKAYYK
jgi:excisionase family DNA binding protein